jgi:hypothetical protein
MTNRDIYIAAILDYLLLKKNRKELISHLHNKCAVLEASPENNFFLMVQDKTLFIYELSTNKRYLIERNIINSAQEDDESFVQYCLNGIYEKYDVLYLLNNVSWNENERRLSFTEFYSNFYAEYGVFIECDFSKEKIHIKRSKSCVRRYKTYQQEDTASESLSYAFIDNDNILD